MQGNRALTVQVGAFSTLTDTSFLPNVNPSHSASNRVRRVQNTQPVVFDLPEEVAECEGEKFVRAVHFFIGDEGVILETALIRHR